MRDGSVEPAVAHRTSTISNLHNLMRRTQFVRYAHQKQGGDGDADLCIREQPSPTLNGRSFNLCCRGKGEIPGGPGVTTAVRLEGIVWVLRTGAPWRDVPPQFGKWNTLHRRFRRWTRSGVFDRVFTAKIGDSDLRSIMVDGTFAKVHQHGTGALTSGDEPKVSAKRQKIGRSKGGLDHEDHGGVGRNGRNHEIRY